MRFDEDKRWNIWIWQALTVAVVFGFLGGEFFFLEIKWKLTYSLTFFVLTALYDA